MSIYHLHIPRTAGIHIKNHVLPHLITGGVSHFVSNRTIIEPSVINKSLFVGGHFGTMPLDYMDNPEVFTIIRNPVDRFVSYFKYTTGLIRAGKESEEKLESWLYGEQSEMQSNLQTKFLIGKTNIDQFNKHFNYFQHTIDSGWYLEGMDGGSQKAIDNLQNFYYYTLEDISLFKEDLNKALKHNFGFESFKHRSDPANRSPGLELNLTKSQISKIEDLNKMDMEVYEYVSKNKKRY